MENQTIEQKVGDKDKRTSHACPALYQSHCLVSTEQCHIKSSCHCSCDVYIDFVRPYLRSYVKIREHKEKDERHKGDVLQ